MTLNPLYLIFSKLDECFEENDKSKYLMLVPINESKEKFKKDEEFWSKIRDLIRSIAKNLDDYDERYLRIKFTSDDESSLNKTIEIPSITIIIKVVFHENNKYYSQAFLDECLHELDADLKAKSNDEETNTIQKNIIC